MKKFLLSMILFASFGYFAKVEAQCTIQQSSIIVNIKSVTSDGSGGCTTIFDLTYDIDKNDGNKWAHLLFWDANAAPNPPINWNSKPTPTRAFLENGGTTPLLQAVSLDYFTGSNVVSSVYAADPTNITPYTTGVSYTRTDLPGGLLTRFTIKNILVHTTHCNPLNLKADVWSSQDKNGKIVACGTSGLSIRADEPLLRGLILCNSNPRTYTVSIQTKTTRDVTFTAYKDVAPLGVFDGNDLLNVVDGPRTVTNTGDASGVTYNSYGPYAYAGGEVPGNNFSIWVVASAVGITNSNNILIDNSCAALPVKLKSFTANRNHSDVEVKWTTATEQNNSGFELQKLVGAGGWQKVAFIASKADGGNSSYDLSYSYNDLNTTNGVTQYRLLQTDFDGQLKYSEIRSVRGEGQATRLLVFPNPTSNGNVKVVFEDASGSRDVSLMDINGRTVKQWKNVTNNTLQIENLVSGMYNLRVINRQTGEQTIEKIIVSKK